MTALLKEISDRVRDLPQDERAELAHELIESLDSHYDSDSESAWEAEIERRVGEIKNGTATGYPAEQVLAEIRARRL